MARTFEPVYRKERKLPMWIAKNRKDYEVIDTSAGEKLERWGKYLLIRLDPQVIWNTPQSHSGWKKRNGHYHRSNKGGGEREYFNLPEEWHIQYNELTFHLKPFSFKHTGLFPGSLIISGSTIFLYCRPCSSSLQISAHLEQRHIYHPVPLPVI